MPQEEGSDGEEARSELGSEDTPSWTDAIAAASAASRAQPAPDPAILRLG